MALRVSDLQTAVVSTSALQNQIREQLQMIDTRIREADRVFGRNVITVSLPATFGVPGLEKMEQQRFVYSEIIDSLKKRDFEVRIWLGQDSATLYIAYVVNFNPEQVDAMTEIIKGAMVKTEDIPKFVDPGSKAATGPQPTRSPAAGRSRKPPERAALSGVR